MLAHKEFANFITLNTADLAGTYARLLAESNREFALLSRSARKSSGRKLLNAVTMAFQEQTSNPLTALFQDPARRWGETEITPQPLVEIECLGQTLTPVVTNLAAGKYLWQILFDVRRLAAQNKTTQQPAASTTPPVPPREPQTQPALPIPDDWEATKLRLLINNLPDYVYIKDTQSRYLLVNDEARRHLGAEAADDVVGKTDFDFYSSELAEKYHQDEQSLFESGQSVIDREEQIFDPKQNKSRWMSVTKIILRDNQNQVAGLVGLSRDITEYKHDQEKLTRLATELETVAQVSTAISTILDVDDLLKTVVNLTKERFNLYHAHIYRLHPDGKMLELASGAGEIGQKMKGQGWRIPFQQEASLVARAARYRQPVLVNDVLQSTGFFPNPMLPKTRSELAVPIITSDQMMGVLDVQSDVADNFSNEDKRVYTSLAAQIAVALQNANLYQQTRNTLAATEILYQAIADLGIAQTHAEVLAVLRQYTLLGREAQFVSLNYFDAPWVAHRPPEWITVLARWRANAPTGGGARFPLAAFPSFPRLLQSNVPVVIEDIETDDRLDDETRTFYIDQHNAKSLLFVPMTVAGQWIGYLNGVFEQPTVFSDAEMRQLVSLAGQAAVVLQSIQRLKSSRRQTHREQTIREITEKMQLSTTLEELVQVTAHELGQRFSAEYALIDLGIDKTNG